MGDENDFRPVIRSRRRATITSAKGELLKRPNGASSTQTTSPTWTKPKHKGQEAPTRDLPEETRKDSRNDTLRWERGYSGHIWTEVVWDNIFSQVASGKCCVFVVKVFCHSHVPYYILTDVVHV